MKVTLDDINGHPVELDIPDETVRLLQEIADRNGLTLEAALRSAIQNEHTIEELAAEGKLLVDRGGKLRKLQLA
ncbi:MAG: hypothetical protein ACJ766_02895 [Thermoleophilaceae bacterium]